MRTKKFTSRVVVLLALPFVLGACLRYVPSREEIDKQSSVGSDVAGASEFWAYEEGLTSRVKDFGTERASLETAQNIEAYRFGAGDSVDVEIFGVSELSSTSEIGADGTLSLPLVGPVPAVGLTPVELRENITREMSRYVRSPKVRVGIKEYAGNRVSVIGAVSKPGVYPLRHIGQTLIEIISLAGGRTDKAGTRIVLIPGGKPNTQTQSIEIELDQLTGLNGQPALRVPLIAGDTIVVPEAGLFRVDGEVERAGSFPLTAKTSTLGAVAAAGGFTYSADVNQVEVIRDIGQGKKASVILDLEQIALNGAKDVPLRDGDVVRVPSEPGSFRTRQIVTILNGVFRGGISGNVRYQE